MIKTLKDIFLICLTSFILFLITDFLFTNIKNIRGFSNFFINIQGVGHINKPNFKGVFGGPLDDFSANVSIGNFGERKSNNINCTNKKNVIFLGDSFVAGFEVDDEYTFVSKFNLKCKKSGFHGLNFGVRAYDTHSVIGLYLHIGKKISHKKVFYLIESNDLYENERLFHYKNLVKKFGRYFENQYYGPSTNLIEKIYFTLRIFVSDNFYFTTKLISFIQKINLKDQEKILIKKEQLVKQDQITKLVELLSILNKKVKENDAKLIVGLTPCFKFNCKNELKIEEKIINEIIKKNLDLKVLDLRNQVHRIVIKENLKKEKYIFKKDDHFNQKGHDFISKILIGSF